MVTLMLVTFKDVSFCFDRSVSVSGVRRVRIGCRRTSLLRMSMARRLWRRTLAGRRAYHELERLLGRGKLGDVVFGVGAADVFLHGAVALFLRGMG